MKNIFKAFTLSVIIAATSLIIACGGKENVEPGRSIILDLLESSSEEPAKIRLFFKADFDNGDPIAGLEAENFTISENGSVISSSESLAQIQRDPGQFMFTSVLLLDLSGSVLNAEDLPTLKSSSIGFIESVIPLPEEPYAGSFEMAIYWFDGEENIHLLKPFSTSRAELIQSIESIDENISNDNSTNLNGAVIQGIDVVSERLEQIKLDPDISTASSLVIFTDGTDQANWASDADATTAVNSSGSDLTIFTIGLGSEIDESILSTFGKSGYEFADSDLELNDTFQKVAKSVSDEANSFYVLEYCSPKRSGTHTITVRLDYMGSSGSFQSDFSAEGFTGGCTIE